MGWVSTREQRPAKAPTSARHDKADADPSEARTSHCRNACVHLTWGARGLALSSNTTLVHNTQAQWQRGVSERVRHAQLTRTCGAGGRCEGHGHGSYQHKQSQEAGMAQQRLLLLLRGIIHEARSNQSAQGRCARERSSVPWAGTAGRHKGALVLGTAQQRTECAAPLQRQGNCMQRSERATAI
jgi:hypothetical protein